jgi:type VI secretion system protein ImpF
VAKDETPKSITLSLLDRLMDEDPKRNSEALPTRAQLLRQYKAAVCRDLEWLLNTRRTIEPASGPETARSVYQYGFADISSKSVLSSQDCNDLVREMEAAIAIFEPRLKRARVRLEPLGEHGRNLRFVIEGMLCMDPSPQPVAFDTTLELGKREYEVRAEDRAR